MNKEEFLQEVDDFKSNQEAEQQATINDQETKYQEAITKVESMTRTLIPPFMFEGKYEVKAEYTKSMITFKVNNKLAIGAIRVVYNRNHNNSSWYDAKLYTLHPTCYRYRKDVKTPDDYIGWQSWHQYKADNFVECYAEAQKLHVIYLQELHRAKKCLEGQKEQDAQEPTEPSQASSKSAYQTLKNENLGKLDVKERALIAIADLLSGISGQIDELKQY